jgi:hypothetical protein
VPAFEITSPAGVTELQAEAERRRGAEHASPDKREGRQRDYAPVHRPEWPDQPGSAAFHGPAGELVRLIEPHSEADPAAILVQVLVGFGNLIGRTAYFEAEADRHYMNLFAVVVGQTSKGRKGTSWGQAQRVLASVDPDWTKLRQMSGLTSGEGLIWKVRDEMWTRSPIREHGRVVDYENVICDPGESDKRLMIVEPEFARVLQACERETNTLSAVIRQSWDTGSLRILTKNQAAKSTDAHVSIIGHITKDELRRFLTSTAAGNGFANRFLWVCARRSKILPEGGRLHEVDFGQVIREIDAAANFARQACKIQRDEQARAMWAEIYGELSEGKTGLLGAVTSRAEAQTMRLAGLYALLDCCSEIKIEHLRAGLAAWDYCTSSARFIFGDSLGDPVADEILRALRTSPAGLARTEIRDLFHRNKRSSEIEAALALLQESGLANVDRSIEQQGQIRPTERWFALIRAERG